MSDIVFTAHAIDRFHERFGHGDMEALARTSERVGMSRRGDALYAWNDGGLFVVKDNEEPRVCVTVLGVEERERLGQLDRGSPAYQAWFDLVERTGFDTSPRVAPAQPQPKKPEPDHKAERAAAKKEALRVNATAKRVRCEEQKAREVANIAAKVERRIRHEALMAEIAARKQTPSIPRFAPKEMVDSLRTAIDAGEMTEAEAAVIAQKKMDKAHRAMVGIAVKAMLGMVTNEHALAKMREMLPDLVDRIERNETEAAQ